MQTRYVSPNSCHQGNWAPLPVVALGVLVLMTTFCSSLKPGFNPRLLEPAPHCDSPSCGDSLFGPQGTVTQGSLQAGLLSWLSINRGKSNSLPEWVRGDWHTSFLCHPCYRGVSALPAGWGHSPTSGTCFFLQNLFSHFLIFPKSRGFWKEPPAGTSLI